MPRGCVRAYQGALVAQCTVEHLRPGGLAVREFLASRYAQVQHDGSVLRVQSPVLGTLQVLLDGNSAQFTAIGRETALPVDTSPTQG